MLPKDSRVDGIPALICGLRWCPEDILLGLCRAQFDNLYATRSEEGLRILQSIKHTDHHAVIAIYFGEQALLRSISSEECGTQTETSSACVTSACNLLSATKVKIRVITIIHNTSSML